MNRCEQFNQAFESKDTIDETAVGMLLAYLEDNEGVSLRHGHDVYVIFYKKMKEWLSEEVEILGG